MWLLILVLVFDPPHWPEEQPRPMREIALEYASREECERDMREVARNGEDIIAGWDVLLESCEPAEALIASSLRAQRG